MSDPIFAALDALASEAIDLPAPPSLPPTIGASEVAAVLGLSPWLSPYKLWAQLTGLMPRYGGGNGNLATRRGQILEPALRDWYAREAGIELQPGPTLAESPWTRPDAPWQAARPDGWNDTSLVEIKTTSGWEGWGPEESGLVPIHYATQVLWQQWVAAPRLPSLAETVVVAFDRYTDEIRVYRLPIRLDLAEKIARRVAAWWRLHIELAEPPQVDGSLATREALSARYPVDFQPELDPSPELVALVDDYRLASEMADSALATKERARNRLVAAIGPASGVRGLCTYRASKPRLSTDLEAVEKAHPGLLSPFQTPTLPTRTLRLKKDKSNG